ncbi:hypothetical protein [Proteus mirabilis]|uniref:hypothetical protein n=1 Tax=Proteus mirabilis TaxID=584 RepID=UPI002574C191|nr:hypothetical protein [Proteus mirabilis]MDM3836406.1 hypothetical protein [Proteus mirabilis]
METSKKNVKIYWTPVQQGGKKSLPLNLKYYVITEPMIGKNGDISSWSVVLNIKSNEQVDSYQRIGSGEAYFLMEDAPSFLLTPGFIMNVYEGPKLVGEVEVL